MPILKEIYRKSIHISSLVIPLAYKYLFLYDKKKALGIIIPLTVIAIIIELFRLESRSFKKNFYRFFGLLLRKHEITGISGATYLMASSVVMIAFFPREIAFVSLAFLAIGDTVAALVGKSWGSRKFKGQKKSLEGSLACFLSTYVFALFFLHPFTAICGAVAGTVAEAANLPLDDNIKIPLFSALTMSLAYLII